MTTVKRIQITLNVGNNEMDKTLVEWMQTTGFKDATLARNALIYYYRVSNGLSVNPSPHGGSGVIQGQALIENNNLKTGNTDNYKGKQDKEFEKETENSLKGLFSIGKKNKKTEGD